jgi:TDG/mug DNA glycosylase family protein
MPPIRLSPEQMERHHDRTLPDLVQPGLRLLWVGISPGLWSVAVQAHFAHPANRFWPALHSARIIDHPIRVSTGMSDQDRRYFTGLGMGIASLAPRATEPDAVTPADLRAGWKRLADLVKLHEPQVVAICGITGYQLARGRRGAIAPGRQQERLEGAAVWTVPNPSVANPHVSILELGAACRAVAVAAGIVHPGRRHSAASDLAPSSPHDNVAQPK